MKIFINALSARQGGGQTYLINLLERLPLNNDIEVFLISPNSFKIKNSNSNIIRINTPKIIITNPILRNIWEHFTLTKILKRFQIDVLFCPGGSVSKKASKVCKVVLTFQNMMPFDLEQRKKYPIGYMRFRNWALNRDLSKSMERADLVIFISKFAESIIKQKYKIKIKKSIVIPHGVDPIFRKNDQQITRRPSWLPKEKYFLYVSTLDIYKSQIEVIYAYSSLKKNQNIKEKLVLIGSEYKPYGIKVRQIIKNNNLEDDVIIFNQIQHESLPLVYQHASLNIFASKTENCPFILLEAMSSNRPLLVSNCQPMPEFGGNSVIYFNPYSSADLYEKLKMAINNEDKMLELSEKSFQYSKNFNWNRSAKLTWKSFNELI
jgi:glycosyltransferase involved in cell wall biosynthesis